MEAKEKIFADYTDEEIYAYQRGYRHGSEAEAEISFKAGPKEAVEWMRNHKDYKIMVRLVAGGYRNMTYDSDYKALLEEICGKPS